MPCRPTHEAQLELAPQLGCSRSFDDESGVGEVDDVSKNQLSIELELANERGPIHSYFKLLPPVAYSAHASASGSAEMGARLSCG